MNATWVYDDQAKIQRLDWLVALCPACHEVKDNGLASKQRLLEAVVDHLTKVNGWPTADAEFYVEAAFESPTGQRRDGNWPRR